MTNAPVTSSNKYFMNVANKGAGNNKQNAVQQDFTQAMGRATNAQTEPKAENVSNKKKPSSTYEEDTRPRPVKESVQKSKNPETEGTKNGADEKIEKETDRLVSEVAEELKVSEEEVLAAMEALGMQMVDLLNPDNMAQLVVQISGETDMMSLVMKEELYGSLKDLLQTVETALDGLQKELSATPEELQDLLAEMETETDSVEMPTTEIAKTTTGTKSEVAVTVDGDVPAEAEPKNLETDKAVAVVKTDETEALTEDEALTEALKKTDNKQTVPTEETENSEAKKDGETEKSIAFVEEKAVPDQTDKKQQTGKEIPKEATDLEKPLEVAKGQNAASENKGKEEKGAESSHTFLQDYANKVIQATKEILKTEAPLGTADADSIMKQMMDSIKLHVGTTITEMEIQLQPANLGNVNLQVAMKNGVVTAQITAETEAVKKAIESQVVQLRENLSEQGIKIEAVEVTVASHEFERNLNQGQQNTQSEGTQTTKGTGRKRIVLDEIDGEAEEALEEQDRIQVQMMKQNGSTVDMTA